MPRKINTRKGRVRGYIAIPGGNVFGDRKSAGLHHTYMCQRFRNKKPASSSSDKWPLFQRGTFDPLRSYVNPKMAGAEVVTKVPCKCCGSTVSGKLALTDHYGRKLLDKARRRREQRSSEENQ